MACHTVPGDLALFRAASDDDRYQRQCGQDDRSNADLLHLLSPS
jgi:hypothetical protein